MSWAISAGSPAAVGSLIYAGTFTNATANPLTGVSLNATGVATISQIQPLVGFNETNSIPLLNTTFTGALSATQLKVVLIPADADAVGAALPAVSVSTANGMLFACPAIAGSTYTVLIFA
jgi:hypothetical protein